MERVQIADATADQLRQFGVQVLGLEVTGRENKQVMQGKFAEVGYGLSFITLMPSPDAAGEEAKHATRRENEAFSRREDTPGRPEVKILVHTDDKPGGDRPVPVGVNGKIMLIPRGEPVWVPVPFVEVLNNAEEFAYDQYNQSVNDGMGGLQAPRKVKSYPFSFA